ncbi:MAG TPA: hypothetical protein VIM87_17155 [Chitinophaga sp.]|uniref:hypothetical protein n=1 Tax=Chitinophaga sp. TaxID=1869181 RepID=UPI002F944F10
MQKCLRVLPMHILALAWLCPALYAQDLTAVAAGPAGTPREAAYQLEELTLKNVFRQTENRFGISIAYKSELVKSRKVKLDLTLYH